MHESWNLPTDAFVEILLRLPPSSRRLIRLVCRHWRDVIDERTLQSQPTAYLRNSTSGSAFVIDDLAEGRCRELWRSGPFRGRCFSTVMVGTCNGLLCLCDNNKRGGAISLVNPVTGETLDVPPLPCSGHWARYEEHWLYSESFVYGWNETYSFAYHPTTGRYKILHLPCYFDKAGGFNTVQVFTLEEATWRDAPALGATCCLAAGLVSVDGATSWVTKDTGSVVSFDLKDERVTSMVRLPVTAGRGYSCHLTEVHGRLGLVVSVDKPTPAKTEVWVLGDGSDRQGWSRRYSVQVHGVQQRLARPHFAHGKYVLTVRSKDSERKEVFGHRLRDAGRLLCGEVQSVRIRELGTAASGMSVNLQGTFAYVETTEPLGDYKLGN